jgi:hypothetical protein
VLFALPQGVPVRTGESGLARKIAPRALLGSARHTMLARRRLTTDRLVALDRVVADPEASPGDSEIEQLVRTADHAAIEVMVHPDREHDYRVLMSDMWHAAMQQCKHGSYAELATVRA